LTGTEKTAAGIHTEKLISLEFSDEFIACRVGYGLIPGSDAGVGIVTPIILVAI